MEKNNHLFNNNHEEEIDINGSSNESIDKLVHYNDNSEQQLHTDNNNENNNSNIIKLKNESQVIINEMDRKLINLSKIPLKIKKLKKVKVIEKYIRTYVEIDGVEPFCLILVGNLKKEHYIKIINQYYTEKLIKNKNIIGFLELKKFVKFSSKHQYFKFSRELSNIQGSEKYSTSFQEIINLYEDFPFDKENITMYKKNRLSAKFPKVISLNRLIKWITCPFIDKYYQKCFLYHFKYFMKTSLLFSKLFERFNIPVNDFNSSYKTRESYKNIKNKYATKKNLKEKLTFFSNIDSTFYNLNNSIKIKLNILNLYNELIENYHFDFEEKEIELLNSILEKLQNNSKNKIYNITITKIIEKLNEKYKIRKFWKLEKKIIYDYFINEEDDDEDDDEIKIFNILDYSEKRFSQQLTLMDFKLYQSIHFSEFLHLNWTKHSTRQYSPNLMKNIKFFNCVSTWIKSQILYEVDVKKRAKLIEYFLKVGNYLLKTNSLNMLMSVNAAISSTPIYRLTKTWDLVQVEYKKIKKDIDTFCSSKGSNLKMRIKMDQCYTNGLFCSPFIAIYLKFLNYNEESKTNINGKINFLKFKLSTDIIEKILRFQNLNCSFKPVKKIIEKVSIYQPPKDIEKILYNQSSKIEV